MTLTNSTPVKARAQNGDVSDDIDPAARPSRRTFSAKQKLEILAAYDEATESGAKGALLRREGIYSSQITEWRKAREAGSLAGLAVERLAR
jgi:transposase-like protein